MIKGDKPFCDECGRELVALSEEEALDAFPPTGWIDWGTAQKHYCHDCADKLWEPPCDECRTHPCMKGRECWATPPLHIFPYETYYSTLKLKPQSSTLERFINISPDEENMKRKLTPRARQILCELDRVQRSFGLSAMAELNEIHNEAR